MPVHNEIKKKVEQIRQLLEWVRFQILFTWREWFFFKMGKIWQPLLIIRQNVFTYR